MKPRAFAWNISELSYKTIKIIPVNKLTLNLRVL
jgi:hypothetical protein